MSESSASEFLGKLRADPEMRKALSHHVSNGAMDHALDFAKSNGHDISRDDLVAAYAKDLKQRGYSDEDIKDLSGGNGGGHYGPPHAAAGSGAAYY